MIGAPINGLLSMHGFMGLEGWQWLLFLATGVLALLLIAPVLLWFPQARNRLAS